MTEPFGEHTCACGQPADRHSAAKKLRVEGYPATADDLDHHANLLDGGAK